MGHCKMLIRLEKASDIAAIRAVEEAAFGGPAEARLVDELRAAGDVVFSLVAVEDAAIVGHALLSKLDGPFPALALAPVAVLPAWQRRGIGARLIEDAIARGAAAGWEGIFVLGNPAFYGRFGFSVDLASGFESPYAGPHFMVLALGADGLPTRGGRVEYAAAFGWMG